MTNAWRVSRKSLSPRETEGMKRLALRAGTVERARNLRRNATDSERRLLRGLKEVFREAKFRFQVPFGPYYADFASHSAKLIIEVDGGQHAVAKDYDEARTEFLKGEGYRVIRFWNNDVLTNLDGVLTLIGKALSPCGRGVAKTAWGAVFQATGEGPAASADEKTFRPADFFHALQTQRAPLPIPLPQGEREVMTNQ